MEMVQPFDPDALRAFRDRDWERARVAKERFWAEDHGKRGPVAGLEIGAALWDHARGVDPSWPSAAERAEDLRHHIEFKRKLDRVAHVFRD